MAKYKKKIDMPGLKKINLICWMSQYIIKKNKHVQFLKKGILFPRLCLVHAFG